MKSLINIIIYETKAGKEPYTEWEESLDKEAVAVVQSRLARIRRGNLGDISIIKGEKGVWEIRFDYGPGYRIYFGKIGNTVIILLVGGSKRTQIRDIEKAREYWLDYRKSNEKKIQKL